MFEPAVHTQIPKMTLVDVDGRKIAYLMFCTGPGHIFGTFFGALVKIA